MIRARSQFKSRSIANNVEITIPVPNDVDSPSFKAAIGTVTYVPDKDAIVWSIKQFYGAREYLMRAHFGLPSTTDPNDLSWKKPAQVTFEIPYFTVSGIQVRYLKIIEKSGYQALPWVRYITKAAEGEGGRGGYTLRMS
jgi:AP-1 complex subunit mu